MESNDEQSGFNANAKMDFNPFLISNEIQYSKEEISELFSQSTEGDEDSINKLVHHFSCLAEQMILSLQSKNIPPQFTFTELYDICIVQLRKVIIRYDEKNFYKSVGWWLRQGLLGAFANK